MATMQYLLILCVLAGTLCLAQLDAQSLGAVRYTDCGYGNRQLTVSNVTLYPSSPLPTDVIYLTFNATNPTANSVDVTTVSWTLNFTTPITGNQSTYSLVIPAGGTYSPWWLSNYASLNQIYSSGWIPFQLVFYSTYSVLACWTGSVYVRTPPNPSDCDNENSLINLSAFVLNTNPYNQSFNLTFEVENLRSTSISFDEVYWIIIFNSAAPISYNQVLGYPITLQSGNTRDFATVSVPLPQNISWYEYQFVFYNNGYNIACLQGYQVVQPSPPNPPGCSGSGSQLSVSNVALNPSSPQINQPIYLTFEVENESGNSVVFNNIAWTLNFSTPIASSVDLSSDLTLYSGLTLDLTMNLLTLNQSVTPGLYSYQITFYENTIEIACAIGNVSVLPPPNPPGCFNGNNLLSVNNVVLHPSSPQIHDTIYFTFEVDNWSGVNVTFNKIYSILTFNYSSPIAYNLTLPDLTLPSGEYIGLAGKKVELNQSVSSGTYPYQFVFYSNSTTEVGCWGGNVTIRNHGDCLNGRSQLTVSNVILNPNSPQIYDPVNLTFTVENESGKNVAFNSIYWTLTFTPGSPLSYNQTLGTNVILVSGTSLTLNGNSLTLYESISAGTYPYQLEFYEDTKKIACWGGDVVVPSSYWSSSLETSSSSYIYFLGLAGLSILFTS